MVEQIKAMQPSPWVQIMFGAIGAVGGLLTPLLFVSGMLSTSANNSHDLSQFGNKLTDLTVEVGRLRDRIDSSPRVDQIVALDHHVSTTDGRIDGVENRVRDLETRVTKALTLLDNIDAASRASIGRRP